MITGRHRAARVQYVRAGAARLTFLPTQMADSLDTLRSKPLASACFLFAAELM
jgi:hypothetical protein